MKKEFGEYYLGLDIGTGSVGWAVTDLDYRLQKLNGKTMWGSRLFENAKTAVERRTFRSARRRIEREKQRIVILQEIFANEIAKVDAGFYWRLKESRLHEDDKRMSFGAYRLFDEKTDREYYDQYPTVYHLRRALLENRREAFDVRFVYLALAHILRHRGHFLFPDLDVAQIGSNFHALYTEFVQCANDNIPGLEDWDGGNAEQIETVLRQADLSITEKKAQLKKFIVTDKKNKAQDAIAVFLSGGKGKLSDLFSDEDLKENTKDSFGFKEDDFEVVLSEIEQPLGERLIVIEHLKAIYDWSILVRILKGQTGAYLSSAMVASYEEHAEDLRLLKAFVKEKAPKLYREIFGEQKGNEINYTSYVGSCLSRKGKKCIAEKSCTQEEFCDALQKKLASVVDFKSIGVSGDHRSPVGKLFFKIKNRIAFPKQRVKSNGVIPMQLHLHEMHQILQNAAVYFPFLRTPDQDGFTPMQKIEATMKFRIPYYIGPLAGTSQSKEKKRCWVVRSREKITPWNFDRVVDQEKSAEQFILNLTNKCTYLYGEDVLPRSSLTYTEFLARNELNNLSVRGEKLSMECIEGIYKDCLLCGRGKLTKKKIAGYLRAQNICPEVQAEDISGVDDTLQADLQSHKDFASIFDADYVQTHRVMIEDIIRWITIFGDEKQMILQKIKEHYPEVTEAQCRKIKRLRYKDWGRLSQTLLDSREISWIDESTGEVVTLLAAMKKEPKNLMQLLGDDSYYGFKECIEKFNQGHQKSTALSYETVEELAVSPTVRRAMWQAILIVKEIRGIVGHDPKRIFIEMAREEGEKKRTKSRKNQLVELYKSCKSDEPELYETLEGTSEERLRDRRLFLYYTQLGRCMYTGKKIDLQDLYDKNMYDKDHIFPRSRKKDDSLDNLVLVYYAENREKTDTYPLKPEIQHRMHGFWHMLLQKKLISQQKYERLVRKTGFTNEELAGFIQRQIVETRQSTKLTAELLRQACPDSEIVYSKAGNVSDFRAEFDFVKCRDINDMHHAKDAYLNIVVGNVYHTKFTANAYLFIKNKPQKETYTLNTKALFGHDVSRGQVTAWVAGDRGSMDTVARMMKKNNALYTRMQYAEKGQFFDLQPLRKGKGQIPLKKDLPIEKYGGYNKPKTSYFLLVESDGKKGQKRRTLEAVPVYIAGRLEKDPALLDQLLTEEYGLVNPVIKRLRILKNALLWLDGFPFYLTGRTNLKVTGKIALQLILGDKWEKYVKKVFKFCKRKSSNREVRLTLNDEITGDQNIKLYQMLLEKQKNSIYRYRPNGKYEELQSYFEKFIELSEEDQCGVLCSIINWLTGTYDTVDLCILGGKKDAGALAPGKDISRRNSAVLECPSVTGIFVQKIDLLKL